MFRINSVLRSEGGELIFNSAGIFSPAAVMIECAYLREHGRTDITIYSADGGEFGYLASTEIELVALRKTLDAIDEKGKNPWRCNAADQ